MALSSILAPVDFSEESAHGLSLARDIAHFHRAELTLLHVDALPLYSKRVAEAGAPEAWREYLTQRQVSLEEQLRQFARPVEPDANTRYRLARGEAAKAIREVSEIGGHDLIVVAPHGAGHGERFLLGSVSAELATDAHCPVLIARSRSEPLDHGGFQQPLVAVSDPRLARRALALTGKLARPGTSIQLIHVLEGFEVNIGPHPPGGFHEAIEHKRREQAAGLTDLAQPLAKAGFEISVQVETGDPSFTILCRLESNRNHLAVIARKTLANGVGVLSTPAYRLVKHSPVPVLVVPESVTSL